MFMLCCQVCLAEEILSIFKDFLTRIYIVVPCPYERMNFSTLSRYLVPVSLAETAKETFLLGLGRDQERITVIVNGFLAFFSTS